MRNYIWGPNAFDLDRDLTSISMRLEFQCLTTRAAHPLPMDFLDGIPTHIDSHIMLSLNFRAGFAHTCFFWIFSQDWSLFFHVHFTFQF